MQYVTVNAPAIVQAYARTRADITGAPFAANVAPGAADLQNSIRQAFTNATDGRVTAIARAAAGFLYGPANYVLPADGTAPAIVALAVRVLNHMEQETATRAVTTAGAGATLIGTEFSFSDGREHTVEKASINLRLLDPRDRKTSAQKAPHTEAEQRIYRWTDWIKKPQQRAKIPGNPIIDVAVRAQDDASWKPKAEYARKVTYTFAQTPTTAAWTWHWVADIDEGCFETQTRPTSIDDVKNNAAIKAIITEHIFGGAHNEGLHADPEATGGGGHIWLDVTTGFGHGAVVSFETLLETLSHLQANALDLQRRFNAPEQGMTRGKCGSHERAVAFDPEDQGRSRPGPGGGVRNGAGRRHECDEARRQRHARQPPRAAAHVQPAAHEPDGCRRGAQDPRRGSGRHLALPGRQHRAHRQGHR